MDSIDRHRLPLRRWILLGLPIATTLLIVTQLDWSGVKRWSSPLFSRVDQAHRYPYGNVRQPISPTARIEQEIAFYQQRLREHPGGAIDQAALATAYFRMARSTGDGNWYLLADRTAQQSLANLPFDNPEALTILARVAAARHDFAEALKISEQLPPRDALAIQAATYLAIGSLTKAEAAAHQLVDATLSTNGFTLLALVQIAQGNDRAGLDSFQQAIAVEEPGELVSSAQVRMLLGRFYYDRGDLQQAEALYYESLRILPNFSQARLNLAQLELRRGRYAKADRLYQEVAAAQDSPTVFEPLILRGRAQVKLQQDDRSGAEQHWREAETLLRQGFNGADATSFGHQRDLARLLLERGHDRDIPEAIALMQAEIQTRRSADTLDTHAWALSRADRWPEARIAIQAAIAQDAQDAGLLHRAGTIEQALGNLAAAERYFERSRQIDPQFDDAARQAIGLGVGLGS